MANKSVRDVMVRDPWTIDASVSIQKAAQLMRARDVGTVLVTDDGQLRGVLTDHDINVLAIASGRHPAEVLAGDHASPVVHWVAAADPCERAFDYMRHHDLRHLPVLEGTQLVGTVWVADLAVAANQPHTQRSAAVA